jgi:hypothetical protein
VRHLFQKRVLMTGGAGMTQARPIFHLHIRKAAGSSLRVFMSNKFAASACLTSIHRAAHAARDPNAFQFVSGHASFDYVRRFTISPRVVTALREPLDRTLSAYYYARSQQTAKGLQSVASERSVEQQAKLQQLHDAACAYSLEEMLEREPDVSREEFSNVQTRSLAGSGPYSSDEALLAAARRNLESCEAILLTERMDESLNVLCRTFGWDPEPHLPHQNVTKDRKAKESLSPTLRSTLVEMNRLDIELYQHAVKLFEQRRSALPDQKLEANVWPVPDAKTFTFDQPIRGSGWHARLSTDGEWFSWTGREAKLYLQRQHSGAHHFRLRVRNAASPKALHALDVEVNGERLSLKRESESCPCELTGIIPRAVIRRAQRIELVLRPGEVRQLSDLNPAAVDRRWLGLAISGVCLEPVPSRIACWLQQRKEKLTSRRKGVTAGSQRSAA